MGLGFIVSVLGGFGIVLGGFLFTGWFCSYGDGKEILIKILDTFGV